MNNKQTFLSIFLFSLSIAGALLLGPILAYPVQCFIGLFMELEYRKYINYTMLLTALICCCLYLKYFSLLTFKSFGYLGLKQRFFGYIVKGFFLGVLVTACLQFGMLYFDFRYFDSNYPVTFISLLHVSISAITTGLAVGLIEETIFRGGFFTGLQKASATIAVVLSSLVYALVHFIRYTDVPTGMEIGLFTGISMMPNAFQLFKDPLILNHFLCLLVIGIWLALVRLRYGHIAICIGIHAGIVAAIKLSKYYTNHLYVSKLPSFINRYEHDFGWHTLALLIVVAGLHLAYCYRLSLVSMIKD